MVRGEGRGMNGGSGDGIVRGRGEKGPKGSILILFAGLSLGEKMQHTRRVNKSQRGSSLSTKSTRVLKVNKLKLSQRRVGRSNDTGTSTNERRMNVMTYEPETNPPLTKFDTNTNSCFQKQNLNSSPHSLETCQDT